MHLKRYHDIAIVDTYVTNKAVTLQTEEYLMNYCIGIVNNVY